MENGTTVLVVVGYQLQCTVLENGWPQSGRSINGSLGQAKNKDKGAGKGELIGASDPPHRPHTRGGDHRGYEHVFDQWSSPLNGIDLHFQGMRQ
eukprot:9272058-Pyramimonas_sp.AAC.1